MNSIYGLTVDNMLRSLPDVLKNDSSIYALAKAITLKLAERPNEIAQLSIYNRIAELPEALLDILAYDFKVDWWDANYTLEEKRKTLADNWRVHRMLGTKAAVETAISAIYSDTQVREWFDYDGIPYHFKLLIDATYENVDPAKHQRVLSRVNFYKNQRSVLDGIEYVAKPQGYCRCYTGVVTAGIAMSITVEVPVYGLE